MPSLSLLITDRIRKPPIQILQTTHYCFRPKKNIIWCMMLSQCAPSSNMFRHNMVTTVSGNFTMSGYTIPVHIMSLVAQKTIPAMSDVYQITQDFFPWPAVEICINEYPHTHPTLHIYWQSRTSVPSEWTHTSLLVSTAFRSRRSIGCSLEGPAGRHRQTSQFFHSRLL